MQNPKQGDKELRDEIPVAGEVITPRQNYTVKIVDGTYRSGRAKRYLDSLNWPDALLAVPTPINL